MSAAHVAVASFVLFTSFAGLNAGELYRNEGLRALLGAECLRGHWIVPTLYGEPILTKPPLAYWLIALTGLPAGGVTPLTARVPSVLAALTTALLLYWQFRRMLGEPGGLLAAGLLPCSLCWLDKVPSAEIDAINVFWVAAGNLLFLRAIEAEESGRPARHWWLGLAVALAGGALTKWAAPVFVYGMAIPLLAWRGQLRLLFRASHFLAIALAATIVLAWLAAVVHEVGWEMLRDQVGREALNRLSPGHNGKAYPWAATVSFPLRVAGAFLPLSLLAMLGLRGPPNLSSRFTWQALHCWLWPNLLFWSILPEHAARNAFPLIPAVAGFAALGLVQRRVNPRIAVAGAAIWMAVTIVFAAVVVPARTRDRGAESTGRALALAVPPGETLYLNQLKDEGVMFYYGRPALRVPDLADIGTSGRPRYCIVTEAEWMAGAVRGKAVGHFADAQGDPITLVFGTGEGGP